MKIATLTIDEYNNHGNILQRYALCEILKKYTTDVDTIWADNNMLLETHWSQSGMWLNSNFKQIVKFFMNWKGFCIRILTGKNAKIIQRDTLIKSFCDRYIKVRYNVDFDKVNDEYDYFVVGSDQVWNPMYELDYSKLMLRFASSHKRISYAASISVPKIPSKYMQEYIDGINGMAFISVREHSGATLIKKISGRDVKVVLDPTFILEKEEWRRIARKPSWLNENEKYLLTYFLGPAPDTVISKVAKNLNLKVINIFGLDNFNACVVGPEEWLYLIDHANLVYTDSFHGTVFSIIFNTPFIITERLGDCNMVSRFDSLLSIFGFENRKALIQNGYEIESPYAVDFSNVEVILKNERKRAYRYLDEAIICESKQSGNMSTP